MRSRPARWLVIGALAASALSSWAAEAAQRDGDCADNPGKCYSFDVRVAPTPLPGDDATYTGTLTNLSKGGSGVQLGSANVSWEPSDAFFSVTPVSVSPRGSLQLRNAVLELRDLAATPGETVTFTFRATALRAGEVAFHSTAKQANRYAGPPGNNLTQTGADPTITVSGDCGSSAGADSYGCGAVAKQTGGEICTTQGALTVTACIDFPGVTPAAGSSPVQVMALRTLLQDGECPLMLPCEFVVQLLRKLDTEYDGGARSATLTIVCGDLCSDLQVYLQQDELSGITEPLLPCLPVSPVPSPLTGSTACVTDNGDGTVTVFFVTRENDWKVAG